MSLEPGGYGVYQHLVALAAGAAGAINVNGVNSGMAALKTDTAAMGRAKDADTSAVTHADAANAHDVSSNGTVDRSVAVGSAVLNGVPVAMRPTTAKAPADGRAASGTARNDRTDAVSAAEAATASALSGIKAWGKPRPSPSAAVNIQ